LADAGSSSSPSKRRFSNIKICPQRRGSRENGDQAAAFCESFQSKNGSEYDIGGRPIDRSSVLVISGPAIVPWARETMWRWMKLEESQVMG
jgi:hypothetical protein